MDSLRPSDHLARTQTLHRPQTQVRRLPAGKYMSRRRQNLEHRGDTQERESVAPLNFFFLKWLCHPEPSEGPMQSLCRAETDGARTTLDSNPAILD